VAAWRFYRNPRTSFTRLARPLIDSARQSAQSRCRHFAIVPLDWSKLGYKAHPSKADRTRIGNSDELGYKPLSALLLSNLGGLPLAPLCAELTGPGHHSRGNKVSVVKGGALSLVGLASRREARYPPWRARRPPHGRRGP
jgi:hypothetical protein